MKPEAQRIAIAEACGWVVSSSTFRDGTPMGNKPNGMNTAGCRVPDYIHDLNAMHEAEKTIHGGSKGAYFSNLGMVIGQSVQPTGWYDAFLLGSATADQRAEAFLRTIGKWVEDSEPVAA